MWLWKFIVGSVLLTIAVNLAIMRWRQYKKH
jgi:hypothetical protein